MSCCDESYVRFYSVSRWRGRVILKLNKKWHLAVAGDTASKLTFSGVTRTGSGMVGCVYGASWAVGKPLGPRIALSSQIHVSRCPEFRVTKRPRREKWFVVGIYHLYWLVVIVSNRLLRVYDKKLPTRFLSRPSFLLESTPKSHSKIGSNKNGHRIPSREVGSSSGFLSRAGTILEA